jgi:hypothetical protein
LDNIRTQMLDPKLTLLQKALLNTRLHSLKQCEQTGVSLEHRSFRFLHDAQAG